MATLCPPIYCRITHSWILMAPCLNANHTNRTGVKTMQLSSVRAVVKPILTGVICWSAAPLFTTVSAISHLDRNPSDRPTWEKPRVGSLCNYRLAKLKVWKSCLFLNKGWFSVTGLTALNNNAFNLQPCSVVMLPKASTIICGLFLWVERSSPIASVGRRSVQFWVWLARFVLGCGLLWVQERHTSTPVHRREAEVLSFLEHLLNLLDYPAAQHEASFPLYIAVDQNPLIRNTLGWGIGTSIWLWEEA